MKKTDKLVEILKSQIEGKDILEVACGGAEFSILASSFAKTVSCIDLDDSRLSKQIEQTDIMFRIMDASKMDYSDGSFDTIVIYNAFSNTTLQIWRVVQQKSKFNKELIENELLVIICLRDDII